MEPQLLARTINAWDMVGNAPKSLLFIGPINHGKSTLAELINKYQFGVDNPRLTFDKDKYILDNVISSKSLKPQTVVPAVYRQAGPGTGQLQIVQVPCYCLPPQLKKWSSLDQKLTINLMLERCQKTGFLIFVDEKYTRTNAQNWKKVLMGFLEMFRECSDDILNSVGWIITKSPPDLTEDAAVKRFQNLQQTLKTQKTIDPILVDKLFDNAINNNRIFIFKKVTGVQENEAQDIRNIFAHLPALCNYHPRRKDAKDSIWNQQEENLLKGFIQQEDSRFTKVLTFMRDALKLVSKPDFFGDVAKLKEAFWSTMPAPLDILISEHVKQLFQNKSAEQDLVSVVRWLKSMMDNKIKTNSISVKNYLVSIVACPFFESSLKEVMQFQLALEAIHLNATLKEQDYFESSNGLLGEVLEHTVKQFIQNLKSLAADNDNELFYESVIDFLETDKSLQTQYEILGNQCKEGLLKFRSPIKIIHKMIETLEQGPSEKHVDAAIKIATALEKEGFIAPAANIFKMTKSPGDALRCLSRLPPQTLKEEMDLIDYYAELCLFEAAKAKCYQVSGRLGWKSRGALGEQLQKVMVRERAYIKSTSGANVLLGQVILQKGQIDQIKQEASLALSRLQSSRA